MNILYCNNFRAGKLEGASVHIYEVISRLSEMGHNITLLSGDYAQQKVGKEDNESEPLWKRIEKGLVQWRLFRTFNGELQLIGIFRYEIYIFFSVLIILRSSSGSGGFSTKK